nr:Error-prone repair protein UmuD [Salmonella enterica subsp. enterica serovar Weltevreden]
MGNILNNTVYKNRHFKRYAMLLFVAPEQEPVQSTAPLFTERCPAGFPSPAADYTEEDLDLNA